MSHGVPYFVWRDGRGRWVPGSHLRARGFRGRDLKDGKGNWLDLEPALDMARQLNIKAEVRPKHNSDRNIEWIAKKSSPRRVKDPDAIPDRPGYIYFLLVEDAVKIGFSINPFQRGKGLLTGLHKPVSVMLAVPGTTEHERKLHVQLHKHRLHGEWFAATEPVLNVMQRALIGRKIRQ